MKRILLILSLTLFVVSVAQSQDDDNDRIRDKMREFIQKRLDLNRNEAERFAPVFVRYFREWRQTLRENKDLPDMLERQKRIVDLKIRYRTEFRDIVGEKKSNEIFKRQDEFVQGMKDIREKQIKARIDERPTKRNRSLLE